MITPKPESCCVPENPAEMAVDKNDRRSIISAAVTI